MGYNTAVLILNDAAHNLETDPDVGRKLYKAMGESQYSENRERGVDFSIGNHCNGGLVLPAHHADDIQVLVVGRNYMRHLGKVYHVDMEDPVAVTKQLADSLGYKLVKKAAR